MSEYFLYSWFVFELKLLFVNLSVNFVEIIDFGFGLDSILKFFHLIIHNSEVVSENFGFEETFVAFHSKFKL